jgi:23S rRNA (guanosine2251-2'-O)-methyltransferase
VRLVCGLQPVREAIRAHGRALEKVLVMRASPQLDHLARFAQDQGAVVKRVDRAELDRLAKGARHQGAIAIAPELALVDLAYVAEAEAALVVALDELEDPQNFGAIVRSAVAMGASAVVWPEHHSAPLTPATFRASAGAVEHATLCRVRSLPEALNELAAHGLAIVGLDAAADQAIDTVDLRSRCVLVVGAEGKGLRRSVKRACGALARLPMAGAVASLNASVSAAIALYEARRQRGRARVG